MAKNAWVSMTALAGGLAFKALRYECHEGNRALLQALGGARAEDRALEEDRKKGIIRARAPVQNGLTVGGTPIGGQRGAPPAEGGEATPTGRWTSPVLP